MLFFAAALLYSSVHLFGVAGSAPAPENSPAVHGFSTSLASQTPHATPLQTVAVTADVLTVPPAVPAPKSPSPAPVSAPATPVLTAPVEGVPADSSSLSSCGVVRGHAGAPSKSGRAEAAQCLTQLGQASRRQLERFARSLNVSSGVDIAFATTLGDKGSPAATHQWWVDLAPDRQTQLIDVMPSVVGNLEGVPYDVRNIANRITLTSTINAIRHADAEAQAGLAAADPQTQRLTMLQQVQIALTRGREGDDSERSLVSLDTIFPGRAAVAVGDLDTADNVSIMVPGMLYTVSNQITFWTDRAAALHSEQDFWSSTLATDVTTRAATSAVVAWMGYRTPDLTNVLGLGLAKVGAVHLEDTVKGLDAARSDHPPRLTVIAHSYGSTTATIALSSGTIHADSFVVLGSPGSVVPRASDLSVDKGQVYAAAAAFDPVAGTGFFGEDPGATVFGATLLNVGSATDPFTEQHLTGTISHNDYFVPGSQSMRNLALIDIGRGDLAHGRPPLPDGPQLVNSPSLAFVRPQDVYRD